MSKTVDFYYDYISLASYFGFMRLTELCRKTGATINYKPMLLGGVFKANGNTSPLTVPAKWEWMKKDFARHAEYYGIPYQLNPHFVFSTVSVMRGAFWALSEGRIEDYNRAMFTAAWADGKDLSSADVISEVLSDAGFDATVVMEAMTHPENKQALIQATEAAVERGVFGAPTLFVDDEIYFGQDRLGWVERALL
ncbi:2-hydroxychromene-2-carboxylate isomerase [Amphritea japonica]|uniref:2-hydroxychromene-2-carboxylate isomerase n=1 Tax=Amphritea japonica ATCC BAA-1530 TaxID=1278309 RepID=A0A7R6SS26_9GAMM|nr:2-hydroxychromene-2-carboxylate isomerase [Amphritea japonica]BBB25801.1 DSBA oxidoreductase [Amphritea japonica ATCC BAA-1530]